MSKRKYTAEEKLDAVLKYLKGRGSYASLGVSYGVHYTTIEDWVRNYKSLGIDGLHRQRKNETYSNETKQCAVQDALLGGLSQKKVCQKYKIRSPKQLRNWIKVYNSHGNFNSKKQSGGGSYMKEGRKTTQEERIEIAKECIESEKNYGEVALKHKVSYQQARSWTLRFEELGEAGLEDRRGKRKKNQEPRTELEKLQIENEKLKHQLYLAEMETNLLKKFHELERGSRYLK